MGKIREFLSPSKPDVWKLSSLVSVAATAGALAVESLPYDTPHMLKLATAAVGGTLAVGAWLRGDIVEYGPPKESR